MHFVFAIIAIL